MVELDLARLRVVDDHQRPRVVDQHLPGHAAEVLERALEAAEPRRLPLVPERRHIAPPRVAQRRHEQEYAHPLVANRYPPLAEINLELASRRCLEPHRRLRLGRQQPPERRHRPLDRAQAHVDALLPDQVLAHHLGIAAVLEEALLQPRLLILELAAARLSAVRHPAVGRDVASHRVLAAPELPRDASQPPTERPQLQHRFHLV